MKVVLNKCFGGFGVSKKAAEYMGVEWDGYGYMFDSQDCRTDERLIKCVEELGKEASGALANIEVVEIPDGSFYIIDEYDGFETIYYSASEVFTK